MHQVAHCNQKQKMSIIDLTFKLVLLICLTSRETSTFLSQIFELFCGQFFLICKNLISQFTPFNELFSLCTKPAGREEDENDRFSYLTRPSKVRKPIIFGRFSGTSLRGKGGRSADVFLPNLSPIFLPNDQTLYRARSRLYQRRFLQQNTSTHFAAFFEITKISNPSHPSKLKISAKLRQSFSHFLPNVVHNS